MDLQQFATAVGCTLLTAEPWHQPMCAAMAQFDIGTQRRQAMFLAQVGHESASLSRLEENLNYSAQRLQQVWPRRFPTIDDAHYYEHSPERLANLVYASRMGNGAYESGDGYRYRGRGPIQITGADAYRQAGAALNLPLIEQPEMVLDTVVGAQVAAWVFAIWKGCNPAADADDIDAVTRLINGGTVGLDDRIARYERALHALEG